MGGSSPKLKTPPKAAPKVTMEDENVKAAGDDERRRLRAQSGRSNTVQSMRSTSGYKTVTGV